MKPLRNTRIICTMGPAVESLDLVRSLIRKGMNVARFNFSHGDYPNKAEGIARVREASRLEGVPVGILLDTKGPEIRTGLVRADKPIMLDKGEAVDVIGEADARAMFGDDGCWTQKDASGTRIIVSYNLLADDIKDGARILIADGLLSLEFTGLEGRIIHCRVESGGELASRKNVNVLGVHTRLPAMSRQDESDLRFGAEQGMDYVAASFIRKASDVTTIQKYLASIGSDMPVLAKIEDDEGLHNIEEIIRVSAGIMVARGDLGVQIPPEQVPLAQKMIIRLCNNEGKPVITATQMLDSMIHNPRPTRAESGDVANAILDGSDCVMLSGETASGAYPEAAVETMDRIARTVEASDVYRQSIAIRRRRSADNAGPVDPAVAIAESAVLIADTIGASCIIAPTSSGNTARLLSKYRPLRPILGVSFNEKNLRRMLLNWGVVPLSVEEKKDDSEAMMQGALFAAIQAGYAKTSDKVVFACGIPVNSPLTTNTVRVHVIGNILARSNRGFGGRFTGRVVKANSLEEAGHALRKKGGEILVTHTLDSSFIPIIRIVGGIIVEGTSELPRDILKMVNPDIVYISHVPDAMKLLEDHLTLTLDGAEKTIYEGTIG